MEAHLAPAWDVRHRVVVGFGCAAVAVAAVLAGAMQQAAERDAELYRELWEGTWLYAVGLAGIAGIFTAFMLAAAGSFLLSSRRAATLGVLVLTVAAAWPLFAIAWRHALWLVVNPMRTVM